MDGTELNNEEATIDEAKRDKRKAEADKLRRILVTNLDAIVGRYRSLETYTYLYDYINGTCEIRIKLSTAPADHPLK